MRKDDEGDIVSSTGFIRESDTVHFPGFGRDQ